MSLTRVRENFKVSVWRPWETFFFNITKLCGMTSLQLCRCSVSRAQLRFRLGHIPSPYSWVTRSQLPDNWQPSYETAIPTASNLTVYLYLSFWISLSDLISETHEDSRECSVLMGLNVSLFTINTENRDVTNVSPSENTWHGIMNILTNKQ